MVQELAAGVQDDGPPQVHRRRVTGPDTGRQALWLLGCIDFKMLQYTGARVRRGLYILVCLQRRQTRIYSKMPSKMLQYSARPHNLTPVRLF